jgi:N-acetyl-gamma-glutamyl-phosphate reductase
MGASVFIDGEAGTTGLQIYDRLKDRADIDLIRLDDARRKDAKARADALNAADVAILCLPDDAAKVAVALIESPTTRVIDASTAHRTDPAWVYGFQEYAEDQRQRMSGSTRIANPGCYALTSIAMLHPLVSAGLLPKDWPISINAVSGYSGGGKAMIAAFEGGDAAQTSAAIYAYGLGLKHKHLPEITRWAGLGHQPIFSPHVGRYHRGMLVEAPLPLWALPGRPTVEAIHAALQAHYEGERFIEVAPIGPPSEVAASNPPNGKDALDPESLNDTNRLRLHVLTNPDRDMVIVAGLLDNLGKGASGQAVQTLNLLIGADEAAGLEA